MNKNVSLLHVWSQKNEHAPLFVVGNREGLLALREAVDAALNHECCGQQVCQGDGELYDLFVACDDTALEHWKWATTYRDPYTPSEGIFPWGAMTFFRAKKEDA